LLSDGTWDYVYTGGATPTEQIATSGSSPTTDLLLSDESGNVRGLVQLSSGTHQDQLVNYTDYAAYGNPITQSGGAVEAGGLTTPQTALNSNYVGSTPMGFGEGYTDATGLIYLISRYYDPATGQFLSVDPMVQSTQEPFEYAADDPGNDIDPTGMAVNMAATAAWADQNVNSAFQYFAADCTDFVSQALFYGGGDPMSPGSSPLMDVTHPDDWYAIMAIVQHGVLLFSHTWTVAPDLATHFELNGSGWLVQAGTKPDSAGKWSRVQSGDIIFANWSGSSFSGISHAGVVTGVDNGPPYLTIAQHTPDQITNLSYWLNYGGASPHVWIVAPAPG
jgi:RHS repeat-associated protein